MPIGLTSIMPRTVAGSRRALHAIAAEGELERRKTIGDAIDAGEGRLHSEKIDLIRTALAKHSQSTDGEHCGFHDTVEGVSAAAPRKAVSDEALHRACVAYSDYYVKHGYGPADPKEAMRAALEAARGG